VIHIVYHPQHTPQTSLTSGKDAQNPQTHGASIRPHCQQLLLTRVGVLDHISGVDILPVEGKALQPNRPWGCLACKALVHRHEPAFALGNPPSLCGGGIDNAAAGGSFALS
jgi:hypothetical protein